MISERAVSRLRVSLGATGETPEILPAVQSAARQGRESEESMTILSVDVYQDMAATIARLEAENAALRAHKSALLDAVADLQLTLLDSCHQKKMDICDHGEGADHVGH